MKQKLMQKWRKKLLGEYLKKSQDIFIYINLVASILIISSVGLYHLFTHQREKAIYELVMISPLAFMLIYKLVTQKTSHVIHMILFFFLVSIILSYFKGGIEDTSIIYNLLFPVMVAFLLPVNRGGYFLVGYLAIILIVPLLQYMGLIQTQFSTVKIFMYSVNGVLITIFNYYLIKREDRILWNLNHQVYFDQLTGHPNRERLLKDIENNPNPALLLINVDNFKEMNDILGYREGDRILVFISEILQKSLRVGHVYRLSGSEFAILQTIDGDLESSDKILEEEIQSLFFELSQNPFYSRELKLALNISIGVARGKDQNLLPKSDIALQEAKKKRSRFALYHEGLQVKKEFHRDLNWSAKIEKAFSENKIIPYYQPILNNKTGKIDKMECLARMIDDNGNIHSPNNFIPIAKKSHQYPKLTRTVFRHGLHSIIKKDIDVSFNISIDDVIDPFTIQYILMQLEANRDYSSRIQFEILESEEILEIKALNQFIDQVKEYNCPIAIDDFGTGYSNFDYLTKLRVDYVKIDGSLIKDIHEDSSKRKLVKNIVSITKDMNIRTVAEYVWNEEIFNTVKDLKVDFSQGYFIGKPEPL